MIEFSIPLTPILVAAGIGGAIAAIMLAVMIFRANSNFQRARHSHMANIIHQLRQRNNDWKDVPADALRTPNLWDKLAGRLFRKHKKPQ